MHTTHFLLSSAPAGVDTVNIILGAAIAIIMFGMGLSLEINDFTRIKERPGSVILGLTNQLLLLPLIGFGLISMFNIEAGFAVGVFLLAISPGGSTSNAISYLARGDVALSVTMTAISSTVTVFSIPLLLSWAIENFMQESHEIVLDKADMFKQLLLITIVPIAAGMILRNKAPHFARKAEKPVKIFAIVVLFAIIIGAALKNKESLATAFHATGPAIILLNLGCMSLGFFSARLFKLNRKQATSISIESGIQNATLSMTIARMDGLKEVDTILLPPALYGVFMFISGAIVATLLGRMNMKEALNS